MSFTGTCPLTQHRSRIQHVSTAWHGCTLLAPRSYPALCPVLSQLSTVPCQRDLRKPS